MVGLLGHRDDGVLGQGVAEEVRDTRQGVGGVADAVGVAVAGLDLVAVQDAFGQVARNVQRGPLDAAAAAAEQQRERGVGSLHRLAERHLDVDAVA